MLNHTSLYKVTPMRTDYVRSKIRIYVKYTVDYRLKSNLTWQIISNYSSALTYSTEARNVWP